MTKNPFGVSLTFLPAATPPDYEGYIRAIVDSGVKIVETAGNNPAPYLPALKAAGIKAKPFSPALDTLRVNFNNSADKLQSTLKAAGGNAFSIDTGAAEIATAANDLARRTEQQTASLEETAAALDEIRASRDSPARLSTRLTVAGETPISSAMCWQVQR